MKMLRSHGTIRCSALLIATISAGLLQGCTRDPNVKKAKYLKSGEKYAAEGKQQEAIIQFSNAVKIDKNYAPAHYDLAKSYMKLGAFAGGYAELMRTVELDPKNIQARLDLGSLLLAAKQYPRSKDQATAILALQSNNADAIALLSSVALAQGDRAGALTQIQRALAIDPNRANFHTALGLIQSGDPAQQATAEAELQKAISLDPKNVMAHLVLSGLLQKKGDIQGARQQATTAVQLDPKNLRSRIALVGLEIRANDKAAAEATLLQGTQLMSDTNQGADLLWDYYSRTGEIDKASSTYADLVSKNPKSFPLKITYSHILIQQKNWSKAQSLSDELMKSNSSDPQVAILNGMVLIHAGKVNDAFTALQKAEKNAPDNLPLRLMFAEASLAKGDLSTAEQNFQAAARLDPNNFEAARGVAGVANQLNDYTLLMQVATTTLAHHPDSSDAYLWKGVAELHQNQPEQAAADFHTAIGKGPNNAAAMEELGALRLSQNKLPEGKQLLEEALIANPNDARALRFLVAYYLHEKQMPQAIAVVQQQITKSPSNADMYGILADLQLNAKNGPEALAAAQKAIQLNPQDANALTIYSRAQVMQGNTAGAIASWKTWLAAHPTDARADSMLGALEETQGDQNAAEDYYKKALANQPDQPVAANNLAYIMMERGQDIDVALSLAETAHRGLPNSPSTADTLAWAYYHKGTYGSARDILETVEKANPNNPSIEYHLGMIYSKLGNKPDAITHLKRATTLSPNSKVQKDADQALHTLG